MTRRVCQGGCGRMLGRRNASGLCRRCFWGAASPDREATRIARLRATLAAQAPEHKSQRMRPVSRARLAWCPLEYRDDYRRLTRAKMLPAAQARAAIEEQIALDLDRYQRSGRLQATVR